MSKLVIPGRLREAVFRRDGYCCKHCGAIAPLTVDHIYPETLGGQLDLENLQTLCLSCNSRKGWRFPTVRRPKNETTLFQDAAALTNRLYRLHHDERDRRRSRRLYDLYERSWLRTKRRDLARLAAIEAVYDTWGWPGMRRTG